MQLFTNVVIIGHKSDSWLSGIASRFCILTPISHNFRRINNLHRSLISNDPLSSEFIIYIFGFIIGRSCTLTGLSLRIIDNISWVGDAIGIFGHRETKGLFIMRLDILESVLCRKPWKGARWTWLYMNMTRFYIQRRKKNGLLLWYRDIWRGLKNASHKKLWNEARWAWLYMGVTRFSPQRQRRYGLIFWYRETWVDKYYGTIHVARELTIYWSLTSG